ncbi:hypothetical protein COAQ111491_00690 [Comamonas aquatilis]
MTMYLLVFQTLQTVFHVTLQDALTFKIKQSTQERIWLLLIFLWLCKSWYPI